MNILIYEKIQIQNNKVCNLHQYTIKISGNNCKDIQQLIYIHTKLVPNSYSMYNLTFYDLSKDNVLLISNICESIQITKQLED